MPTLLIIWCTSRTKRRHYINGAFLYNKSMATYEIIYDEIQDAYNWYSAINLFHQINKLKDEDDLEIAKKIIGLNFSQAKEILIPFICKRNKRISMSPKKFERIMREQLVQNFDLAVKKLEKVTGHRLAVKNCAKNRAIEIAKVDKSATCSKADLLFLITTFPAMIVYYEEGVIYTYAKIDDELWGMPLDGILHELMHFQTDFYYRQNPKSPVAKLSEDDYYVLKESLPALLDESWKPIITLPDCSYPEYQELRDKLVDFYKRNGNFDELMRFGVEEVEKFNR